MTDQLTHSQLAEQIQANLERWAMRHSTVTVDPMGDSAFRVYIKSPVGLYLNQESNDTRIQLELMDLEVYGAVRDTYTRTFFAFIGDNKTLEIVIPGFEPFDQTNIELPDCLDTYLDSDDGTW